jgi:hypothetical protein
MAFLVTVTHLWLAGVEVVECEETGETGFADIRDAVAIVEELAAKVNVVLALGKPLTASCWFEVDPMALILMLMYRVKASFCRKVSRLINPKGRKPHLST